MVPIKEKIKKKIEQVPLLLVIIVAIAAIIAIILAIFYIPMDANNVINENRLGEITRVEIIPERGTQYELPVDNGVPGGIVTDKLLPYLRNSRIKKTLRRILPLTNIEFYIFVDGSEHSFMILVSSDGSTSMYGGGQFGYTFLNGDELLLITREIARQYFEEEEVPF